MSTHRFILAAIEGDEAKIKLEEEHHAVDVLRVKTGEKAELLDGQGNLYKTEIVSLRPLIFKVIERYVSQKPKVSFAIGLPKSKKADLIVRQLTEIGAASITFFNAARSVPEIKNDKSDKKILRWRKIAEGALKQSGNMFLPEVSIIGFKSLLEALEPPIIVLYEKEGMDLRQCLKDIGGSLNIVIGPEGGFTEEEIAMLEAKKATACKLGDNILRVETAAVYAAAAADLLTR